MCGKGEERKVKSATFSSPREYTNGRSFSLHTFFKTRPPKLWATKMKGRERILLEIWDKSCLSCLEMSWMDFVSLLFGIVDSYPHIMIWEPGRSFGKSSRSHMCDLSRFLNDPKACAPIPERAMTLVMSVNEDSTDEHLRSSCPMRGHEIA